jgi:histidinol-phosphate aminotransferase
MISRRVDTLLKSRGPYPLAKKYDVKAAGTINLASNESPYGPSPEVVKSLRGELGFIGRYPDPSSRCLKQKIAEYLNVRPDCVAVGNGSDELMDLLCKAFVDPGDRVFIPIPTFELYEISALLYSGAPTFSGLQQPGFEWRVDEIKNAAKGAKLAFIGRPNNPTGNGVNLRGLKKIMDVCGVVVLDEAYVEFAGDSAAKLAASEKNLVVLRTFSKAFGLAGLRVGYVVGNRRIIEIIERIRAPFNVNRLAQKAAIAALEDVKYMKKVVGVIRRERKSLSKELSAIGLRVLPSEANFLMVDVSGWKMDASKFCDSLARRRVLVRDLSTFRGVGRNYVRITVGTPQQNKKLVVELRKLEGKICR